MKIRNIALLFAIVFLLCACNSPQGDTTPPNTDGSDPVILETGFANDATGNADSTNTSKPDGTTTEQGVVDEELLADLTSKFSQWASMYNMVLICDFAAPEELPLNQYLCAGGGLPSTELTNDELAQLPSFNPNLDGHRFSTEFINSTLTEYFGIGIEDLNAECLNDFHYLESTDCYYLQTGLNYFDGFTLISSELLEDGTIRIHYSGTYFDHRVVTMKPLDDRYVFVSNLPA